MSLYLLGMQCLLTKRNKIISKHHKVLKLWFFKAPYCTVHGTLGTQGFCGKFVLKELFSKTFQKGIKYRQNVLRKSNDSVGRLLYSNPIFQYLLSFDKEKLYRDH